MSDSDETRPIPIDKLVAQAKLGLGGKTLKVVSTAANVVKKHPVATMIGAVVGVGAAAAAPFTGGGSILGAVTLAESLSGVSGVATAAAGVAIGGGAGAAMSNAVMTKKEDAAYRDGVEKGKAESAVKIAELSETIVRAAKVYAGQARLNQFVVCLATIGFSVAACDGPISAEERDCVEEYVIGISKIMLPQGIRDRLNEISDVPPSFEEAILHVQKFDRDIWLPIDGLLDVVSEADGDVNTSEQEFLSKCEAFKSLALEGGEVR